MNQFSGLSTHMAASISGIPRKIILRHIHDGKVLTHRNTTLNRLEINPDEFFRYCGYVRENEPQVRILPQSEIEQTFKDQFGNMLRHQR